MSDIEITDLDIWEAGRTERYHAHPFMAKHGQTNADHSWGVVMLIIMLHPDPSVNLLKAAATHDIAERWVGDMPGPFKHRHPDLSSAMHDMETQLLEQMGFKYDLDLYECHWLRLADKLEAMIWMHHHGGKADGDASWDIINELAKLLKVSDKVRSLTHF